MSFSLGTLRDLVASGPVARVVVAGIRGSTPREAGAAMIVTASSSHGTIGGGALERDAIERARACLETGTDQLTHVPLGPGLGQCCGGAVRLLTELWDKARLDAVTGTVVARPLPGEGLATPMSVARILAAARGQGVRPDPQILQGWFIEPVDHATRPVWIYGAGHVGRAIATVLAPLPGFAVTLVDDAPDRFPDPMPAGVERVLARNPADAVAHAPSNATHLVLTYSHALDLELCHRILSRDFAALGLIGSSTKRARFRKRLATLGHTPAQIDRMVCPIGDPRLGKHPHVIAIGLAAEMMFDQSKKAINAKDHG